MVKEKAKCLEREGRGREEQEVQQEERREQREQRELEQRGQADRWLRLYYTAWQDADRAKVGPAVVGKKKKYITSGFDVSRLDKIVLVERALGELAGWELLLLECKYQRGLKVREIIAVLERDGRVDRGISRRSYFRLLNVILGRVGRVLGEERKNGEESSEEGR